LAARASLVRLGRVDRPLGRTAASRRPSPHPRPLCDLRHGRHVYATLDQLLDSPAGAVFTERRYTARQFTIGAAGYRTAHHRSTRLELGACQFQAKLDAIEKQSCEIDQMLELLEG
jgi:hypothetical protein